MALPVVPLNNATMNIEEISSSGPDSCGTALSKYIWYLRDRNVDYTLTWSIKQKAQVYSEGAKYCDLCFSEKTIIMLADKNCLNIRSEILRQCPHRQKFTLALVKP